MTTPERLRRDRRTRADNPLLAAPRHPFIVFLVAVVTAGALTAAGLVLRAHPVDTAASEWFNGWRTGVIGQVAAFMYDALKPTPAIVITIVVAAVVWVVGRRVRLALAFAGILALTWTSAALVKVVVNRPRPELAHLTHHFSSMPTDASFPSGHVAFAAALALTVAVMLRRSRWFAPAVVAGALLVALMALSVAIDGVHYPTDAAASVVWVVGVFPLARAAWVVADSAVVRRLRARAA